MSKARILVAVIALPIVAYAGAKLWVRHSAKEALDQLTVAARPFASLQYKGIASTLLTGRVAVEDLRIRPHGFSEDVAVRELAVRAGDPWTLLTASGQLGKGEFPPELEVAARGITLATSGPLLGALDSLQRVTASADALPRCGGTAMTVVSELRALGYGTLDMDIVLRYEYQRSPEQLKVSTDWTARDMAALQTEFTLLGAPGTWKLAPNLDKARLVYKDLSYSDRLRKYCAKAGNITEAAYIDAEVNKPEAAFRSQWGFVPGPGLRAAYRQFLEKPGELIVEARPGGIDPRALQFYKPEDVLAQLNLQARVNGTAISDLSFMRQTASTSAVASVPASAEHAFEPPPEKVVTPTAAHAVRGEYRAVRVGDLNKHIGKQVRISLPRGVVREGTLTEALPNLVTVARDYGRGDMKFEVLVKQVEKAEVRD